MSKTVQIKKKYKKHLFQHRKDIVDISRSTSPFIQPCNQEVIFSLKSTLKAMYFNRLLTFVRQNCKAETDPYTKFLKQYTLLDSINDLDKTWNQLPRSIIIRSFNNLLKKSQLCDSLAQTADFEGFGVSPPAVDDIFTSVTDAEQQCHQSQEVAKLTTIFKRLSQAPHFFLIISWY